MFITRINICNWKNTKIIGLLFFTMFLLIFTAAIGFALVNIAKLETSYSPECVEILEKLAIIEGSDYSNITIAKTFLNSEKINLQVKTWRGYCYYGIGILNGKITIVSNKPFKDPTLLAFSDSKTIKDLLRNPNLDLFQWAIKTGKIKFEAVGFANKFKFGIIDKFAKRFPTNFTQETLNASPQTTLEEDFDNDGIANSLDRCDPYLLKNQSEDHLAEVIYYSCSIDSAVGEEYNGTTPYEDIYDDVFSNGCGVKDTDGGVRYYKKGSIFVENVTYHPPEMRESMFGYIITRSHVVSRCIEEYTDYCLDNETLVEYYYDPPRRISHPYFGTTYLPGQIKNETHKCLFGCKNGQCILKDMDLPVNESCYNRICGFQLEARGEYYPYRIAEYEDLGMKIISLKTGKSIDNLSREDEFSDVCLDNSTLKEYYLTTEIKIGPFGRFEDHPAVKEENYRCHCYNGICRSEGDIKIVDVQPVQVVDGAPLVKGKGTAFRVILNSTFKDGIIVDLELQLPQNEWNYTGINVWRVLVPGYATKFEVILPYDGGIVIPAALTPSLPSGWAAPPIESGVDYRDVPRPVADRVSFTLIANVSPYNYDINLSNNVFRKRNIDVVTTRPFRVMYFVHVSNSSYLDIPNNIIKCSVQNESFCKHGSNISLQQMWQNIWDIARVSTEYLLGVAPIADKKVKFGINFSVNVQSDYSDFVIYLQNIYRVATQWGYDAVVTIDPCDRCGRAWPGGEWACTIGGAPGSQPSVLAHELLSHEISEFREECYSCKPGGNTSVDCKACVASKGFWVNRWRSYEEGKFTNGRFSGPQYYAGNRMAETDAWQRLDDLWEYGNSSNKFPGGYLRLIEKLNDTNDPAILIVSGNIYKNGSAEFDRFFEIIEGCVEELNTSGEYYVVLLDSEGKVLNKHEFDPSFEIFTYEGIVQTNQYPFVFKILWDNRTARIELRHKNEILASKLVSRNKPEISIISPTKGSVFKENDALIIKWNASDADGDELLFSIGLTQDKETWMPLTSNIKNNEYVLNINNLNRGTYWIKVRATDGVNTAEDISEIFLDVPIIEQRKEICGNNICNLRFENTLTCQQDCPSGISDNICDMIKDNKLDPDCKEGIDPDDTTIYEKNIGSANRKSNFIVYGILLLAILFVFGILIIFYKIVKKLKKKH